MRVTAHPGGLTALSATAAVAITLSISASSELRFAIHSPSGNVALETATGLIAALAAFLAYGRYRVTGFAGDLALVAALALLAATVVLFFTGPALTGAPIGRLSVWARALGTLLAAGAFGVAAFTTSATSTRRRRHVSRAVAVYAALALGGLVVLLVLRPPVAIPRDFPPGASRPLLVGSPLLLSMYAAAALLFGAAAVGFVRRCRERRDGFTLALALSMPLAAGASVHYLLFPSRYPAFVFTGDVFRMSFFVVILSGVLAQIGSYVRAGERLGARRERERLARDLHDGPVQELALLRVLIDQLASRVSDPAVTQLDERAAAALTEYRAAIASSRSDANLTFADAVDRAAHRLVEGTGTAVDVVVGRSLELGPEEQRHVLAIVREAISNAVRHGRATHVSVEIAGPPLRVAVVDDGTGLASPTAHEGQGRGLPGLHDRAAALGGRLTVLSSGSGTQVVLETRSAATGSE